MKRRVMRRNQKVAAVRIQAAHRGRVDRHRVKNLSEKRKAQRLREMKQQEEITAAVRIQAIQRGRKDRRRFKENLRERENMSRDSIDEEDYSDENYSEDEFNMSAASMLASPARTMAEAEQVESEGYLGRVCCRVECFRD